jgi:uncharacterized protein YjbJ (UPF0337 family)
MDGNRVAGSINEVKGAAKEAIGEAVGDARLQSDGEADKAVGKIQNLGWQLERRGARRGSHEVRGPPRGEPNQTGHWPMSTIHLLMAILLGDGDCAHNPRPDLLPNLR